MRSARARLGDARPAGAREARTAAASPARSVSGGFLELRESMLEFREREIMLRDLDRGLVDFPALREGREIYLCWQEGEARNRVLARADTGFAGRRPLDDG